MIRVRLWLDCIIVRPPSCTEISRWRTSSSQTRDTSCSVTSDPPRPECRTRRSLELRLLMMILRSTQHYHTGKEIRNKRNPSIRNTKKEQLQVATDNNVVIVELQRWLICTVVNPSQPRQISGLWGVSSTSCVSSVFHSARVLWQSRTATLLFLTPPNTQRYSKLFLK